MLHVGGGDPRQGPVEGIHWHTNLSNRVEFVAAGTLEMKASASITATGGNGGTGYSTVVGTTSVWGGFGAGGSGGSVWLSGTSVTVDAGATIDARGGTGNPAPTNPARTGDGASRLNMLPA